MGTRRTAMAISEAPPQEIIRWDPGYRKSALADPVKVYERIRILQKRNGERLTAAEIRLEARDPDSPLHPLVTWDTKEAARQWQENECRLIVQHLRIVKITTEGEEWHRAFVNVRFESGPESPLAP